MLIFSLLGVKIRNFRKFSISLCREIELEEKIMIKVLLILLGLVCVALGALGVVTPGLPTTPLLLLASWSFYKSSPRLQQWLLRSALGKYIVEYQKKNGMTIRTKLYVVGMIASMCTISIVFLIPITAVKIVVACAGLIGCIVVGFVVRTVK